MKENMHKTRKASGEYMCLSECEYIESTLYRIDPFIPLEHI